MRIIYRTPIGKTLSLIGLMGWSVFYWFGAGGLPAARAQAERVPAQAAAPINDDFNNAIAISVPYTNTQDISEATKAVDDPGLWCSPGVGGNTIWYKYTPAIGGILTIDTIDSTVDTILGVWTGTRGSLTNVGCNDDGAGLQSLLSLNITAGTLYYIELAAFTSTSAGSMTLHASQMNDFDKTSPVNGATGQPANLTLAWGTSNGAASYEYCYDTTIGSTCEGTWNSTGSNTSADLSGMSTGTTYYWQVRAKNGVNTLEANTGTWWSFTTLLPPPASFGKSSPATGSINIPTSPTLSWASSGGATAYQYCYDNTNNSACDSTWISTSMNTSVGLSGLANSSTYYWQVRASNPGGTTYANSGTWWSFSTVPPPLGAFVKSSPANGAVNVSLSPSLSWTASSGASAYQYCYDTSNNNTCNSTWIVTGNNTSIGLSGLATGSVYYWQVRATNAGGNLDANGGAWWSFTTVPTFSDVPYSNWAWAWIERLYRAGITGGCGAVPLTYCPDTRITCAQMAVFLERGMHGPAYAPPLGSGTVFGDVPSSHWASNWIEQLAAEGITGGCGSGNYCPDDYVTRDQMAIFLLRAKYGSTYAPPQATGVFQDVPPTHWAANWIEKLAADGITSGCGDGNYCPGSAVRRAEMAVFLVKTFNLP